MEETISTLLFGKRYADPCSLSLSLSLSVSDQCGLSSINNINSAKTIKNKVSVNKQRSVTELMAIIERLKKELLYYRKFSASLEALLDEKVGSSWRSLVDLPKPESASTTAVKDDDDTAAAVDDDSESVDEPATSTTTTTTTAAAASNNTADVQSRPDDDDSSVRTGESDSASTTPIPSRSATPAPTTTESFNVDASEALAELQIEMQQEQEKHKLALDDLRDELAGAVELHEKAKHRVCARDKTNASRVLTPRSRLLTSGVRA
jgi:hypothetical protein